jgi:hypothetical protein
MAFFKATRDQLKTNAFISNLELARVKFRPDDLRATALHIKWALKAMDKMKRARAEYIFSKDEWLNLIQSCEELGQGLRKAGRNDLADACLRIYDWALQNEDQIGGGVLSAVASASSRVSESDLVRSWENLAAQSDAEAQFDLAMAFATGDSPCAKDCKRLFVGLHKRLRKDMLPRSMVWV